MGKYFELTLQVPQYQATAVRGKRREQQTTDNPAQLQVWHGLAMATVTGLAILYYLMLANSGATASYKITQMQSNMSAMLQQQQQLETQRAELQSMQTIQSNPTVAAMVPVSSVTYLSQ